MLSYAQTEETCIKAVYSRFIEYLPYILLIQSLLLIVAEKFTFRIPRIAQRVERFYKVGWNSNEILSNFRVRDPEILLYFLFRILLKNHCLAKILMLLKTCSKQMMLEQ